MMRPHALMVLGLLGCAGRWHLINVDFTSSTEEGKSVLHLSPKGGNRKGSNVGMALVGGVDFAEGEIEVELKGGGAGQASFLGIAFAAADGERYESVYFRPFNFQADDATHRAHAVQYIAWPEHTWEKLRKESPGRFESAVDPVPDPVQWFKARIDIARSKVSVFVNDAKRPCLVVNRLGSRQKGSVGLWVDSQEGAFANLKIVPRK